MQAQSNWRNILLVALSCLVCFALGEVVLRTLTSFPISPSNKAYDARLGYRLSKSLTDVDRQGFRNPSGKHADYQIAAIGDSHTYGINVHSDESWPYQFEDKTRIATYNFGVGSYGVATYHALVMDNLKRGKNVIVAIYPANDFTTSFSACDIDFLGNTFWKEALPRLQIKVDDLLDHCGQKSKKKSTSDLTVYGRYKGIRDALVNNVASISAFQHLVWDPIKRELLARSGYSPPMERFTFQGLLPPLTVGEVKGHGSATRLDRPSVRTIFNLFEKASQAWAAAAKPGQIGLVLIPSRERVYAAWLRRRGLTDAISEKFWHEIHFQEQLEDATLAAARRNGIPVEIVLGDVVDVFDETQRRGEILYPVSDSGGHPNKLGYMAYANAALRLFKRMDEHARTADTPMPRGITSFDGLRTIHATQMTDGRLQPLKEQ